MTRFPAFEALGCTAAMSGLEDGDCTRTAAGEALGDFLRRVGFDADQARLLRQTHSAAVHVAEALSKAGGAEGDALVTARPGLVLGVTVADCVPVFLLDPAAQVGGLVHAGREGTRRGIAGAAVASMKRALGASPADVHALIGPSAGPCCYEVSPEMAQALSLEGVPSIGRNLDLWAANRQQLIDAGVPADQIMVTGHCTICGGGFHSYRASGTPARNLAILALR